MPRSLAGLPIAITGASSGIGAATAIACAAAGMPVALAARRLDKLREVEREITRAGGKAISVTCDVDAPEDGEKLVAATEEAFGPIYAVFANAGYGLEKSTLDTTDAELRAIFETNFFGTMHTVRPAARRMLEHGRGHVLICSSVVAKFGAAYFGAYCATKAAQNHVARAMRIELAPRGVEVSSVHPIGTRTAFFDVSRANSGGRSLMDHTPDAFMQPPERVARAVVACLRRPRPEVWTSTLPRLGMGLITMVPSLGDVTMRWWIGRRAKH